MTIQCNDQAHSDLWTMYLGDSCDVLKGLPDNSIHMGLSSLPFANLYIYSDSVSDLGNCKGFDEFFEHYKYIVRELYRTTISGRLCVIHCKDLPKYANRDDTAGLRDFPGMIIRAFEECKWSFHSRVTIWKCPVTERERTNNNGLLHKTATRDRSQLRQGMADYLIVMRKPPTRQLMSDEPVTYGDNIAFREYEGDVHYQDQDRHPSPFCRKTQSKQKEMGDSIDIWRRYAEPVWWDINQTDVLNIKLSRDKSGERHVCPLQIGLIRRAVQLWSNPGDVVLSPFAGIGSEGVGAIQKGRKFIGVELKGTYYNHAINNLRIAENKTREGLLF